MMRISLLSQAKDAICILGEEQVIFINYTTKNEIKSVFIWMIAFSKVYFISCNKTMIATTLSVALIKLAFVIIIATTSTVSIAFEYVFAGWCINIKIWIYVLATGITIVLARHGSYTWACVCDKGLRKTLRAHININVEVLQLCGVTIKRSRL